MEKFFKTNVQIKDTLGQNLINDDNLAIIELVKNAFDAKAKSVEVRFNYLSDRTRSDLFHKNHQESMPPTTLIIKDSGKGMSMSDIEDKWLNIAYSEKKDKSDVTTQVFAGDKGIGRFSCDRLGGKLNLYSKKADNERIIHLYIDWSAFEKSDVHTTIEKIPVYVDWITAGDLETKGYKIGGNGTILEITHLRMVWDERKIKTLKDHYLGKLINPNQDYLKEEQKITLSLLCPDFTRLSGEIKNRVFEKLNYRTTSIEAMTHYDEAKKELYITTILRHKGKDILRIVEKNNRFELLKKVKIVLFYLNPYSKARFKEEQGMRSIEYGSIFLFLNGFRVSPYGDKGNDWLGLEERKAQGQRRYLSGRDMVGRIEITDFSGTFKPVSSREGIVKNEAFLLLTKVKMNDNEGDRNDDKKEYENEADKKGFGLVLETVRSFERYVVEGLNWDSGVSLQYVQEFENKIKNGEAIDELYSESDTEKDRKCLEAVRSIIQNRSGDITALTIDKEFIGQLLDSEEEKNKQLLKQLEKYTGTFTEDTREAIDKIQKTLKAKEAELERQRQQLAEAERKRIDAEMRAAQEQKKRAEAEAVARKAEAKSKEDENKRKEAELKQREAESRRKEADLKRQEADKKRAEAELNQRASEMKRKEAEFQQQTELRKRKEAELMQREEENKRKEAELKQREAENLRKEADFKAAQEKIAKEKAQKEAAEKQNQLKVEQSKNIYLLSQRRFNDDVEGLIHHISILLGKARSKMDELVKTLRKQGDLTPYLADEITELRLLVEKTTTISKLITRAGFKKDEDKQIINICDYFQQYIGIYKQIYTNGLVKDIGISFISNGFSINKKVSPLELSIVIDNLIDNAQKFQAKNIVFEVVKYNTLTRDVKIWVYDDGIGLATQFLEYPNQIFELGITTTYGSGIGLHFVKNIMKNEQNINGSITFVGNNVKLKGACFELTFG